MGADKFKNKYRIESNRMPGWDYSGNGLYFITLVVQNWECILGKIKNHKMILSDFGKIVKIEWQKSFEMRAELFCDEYMIMPNHLHAIVGIKLHVKTHGRASLRDTGRASLRDTGRASLRDTGRASLRADDPNDTDDANDGNDTDDSTDTKKPFHRKPKSLSSFVGGFKSGTNTKIDDYIDQNQLNRAKYNKNNHFWLPNYNDHVIRNQQEYFRIKNYIKNNPKKWNDDKFNADDE